MKKILASILIIVAGALVVLVVSGVMTVPGISWPFMPGSQTEEPGEPSETPGDEVIYDSSDFLADVPGWEGLPYAYLNENVPGFSEDEIWTRAQETLSYLDDLGRCGTAAACVGQETMPTEGRGSIGSVKPTGWHGDKYDFIEGGNLYNRCHLIGHQLTGDDAIDRNLLTGTRFMNYEGMLPFENAIAKYVRETGNHVMYRVTPAFSGRELLARGVHLEAISVEDKGEGVSFNVFCYNVQPGIDIDYATGDNSKSEDESWLLKYLAGSMRAKPRTAGKVSQAEIEELKANIKRSEPQLYVLNTNSGKFHYPDCDSVRDMNEKNKVEEETTREELILRGYDPCGFCKP